MASRRKVICWGVAAVLVAAATAAVWFVCSISSFLRHAEFALHGTTLVTMAVEKYVQEHGKWPSSWRDLESVSVDNSGAFSWPSGLGELQNIKEFVEVDFSLTLDQVANQRCEDFRAIRPKRPAFDGYQRGITSLLKTIENARAKMRDKQNSADPQKTE
jgi:hypothetical protein